MKARLVSLALVLLGASGSLTALTAQEAESRQQLLLTARKTKAGRLRPYEPGAVEKVALKVENDRIIERWLAGGEGFFPFMTRVTSGSGVSFGGGYRKRGLFDGHMDLLATAAVSTRHYWLTEAIATFPRLASGRVTGELRGRRLDAPRVDFFGLGSDSRRSDRTDFAFRETRVGGSVGIRILPWMTLGGGADYLAPGASGGTGDRVPSIDVRFDEPATPGLSEQPHFARYQVFLDLNYRRPRGNPRAGGQYQVTWWRYDDLDFDRWGFSRVEVDVQQYFPFLHERRVIALRGFVSLADGVANQQVPFYYQDTLGGHHTLRGFRRHRFRDKNLLLLQAEYRWEIFTAVDAALFYDAGKVASQAEDIDFRSLEQNWGFGFRFGTIQGVFLRLDSAFGSDDGPHFYFTFGHVF